MQRLDVTVDSFRWSERAKKNSEKIASTPTLYSKTTDLETEITFGIMPEDLTFRGIVETRHKQVAGDQVD